MFELDCKGLSCPLPVIETKKAIKEHPQGLVVYIDNIAAKENVSRFAKAMGYNVSVSEIEDFWKLEIVK